MSKKNLFKLVVIVGPTASGKTDLSVFLARKFNGEIVSADSRQVYRGMDIGTGKITKKEMKNVPHFLLDIVSPKKRFTVAQYKKKAFNEIKKIHQRNKIPFLVGGAGFYIQTIVEDLDIPPVKPNSKLRKELENKSLVDLLKQLEKLDPNRAETIDTKNKRRIIRAIEIVNELGVVPSPLASGKIKQAFNTLFIGVDITKEKLKKNIHKRLLARMKQGMIKEVEKLHKSGVSWNRLEELGLEYRYVGRFLRGKSNKEKMLEELEGQINKYAKRQMTWFKKMDSTRSPQEKIHWIADKKEAVKLVDRFLN